MLNAIDSFYLKQDEPVKSCLLVVRKVIKDSDSLISEEWKYKMPFFYYNNKMFCYLWYHKKHKQPYLGIVEGHRIEHADLIAGKRSRMKILLIDPTKDIPIKTIEGLLETAKGFYK